MTWFYIILSYILYYLYCSEVKTESIKSLLCLFTLLERKQRHNNAGTRATNKIKVIFNWLLYFSCFAIDYLAPCIADIQLRGLDPKFPVNINSVTFCYELCPCCSKMRITPCLTANTSQCPPQAACCRDVIIWRILVFTWVPTAVRLLWKLFAALQFYVKFCVSLTLLSRMQWNYWSVTFSAYGCSCNISVFVTGIAAIQRVEMAIRVIYQELYTTIKHEALHKTKGFVRNTLERFISSGEI